MNPVSTDLVTQFREALTDCKRLYTQAARVALQDNAGADDETRRDMIRRMVDLHQGLLIKIFTAVARADARLSRMERELASELVDHIWQQRLEEAQLREVIHRMFRDSAHLQWYSLLRPFDRIAKIRNFVPELQTIVMRVANLVAKSRRHRVGPGNRRIAHHPARNRNPLVSHPRGRFRTARCLNAALPKRSRLCITIRPC